MRTRRGDRDDGRRGGVVALRLAGGPAATVLVALTVALAVAVPALVASGCGSATGAASDAGAAASTATSTATSPAASPAAGESSPAPDVVEQAPVRHVKVGDLDVGYRTIGPFGAAADSTPLLMIMGSTATMDLWSPQFVEALAQGREVVVFDNRGMGETNDPGGAYEFSQLADDTAGLIKALGFDQMDVLGWSMGGSVALDLTVRYPKLVRRPVSYAGGAGGAHAVPMSKKTLAVLEDTSGSAEARGMRLLTLLFPAAYRKADPAYAESFPIPTERMSTPAIALQDHAIGAWKGVWSGLKSISCPTLFVTGAEDVIAPAQNAKLMAAVVPGAELEVVPGAGHGLMYQDPQKLAAMVMGFLDQ
jgi:pimeloyl-ACP methyl ester carboxylesterase